MLGQKGITLQVGQTIHYKSKSMQHPEATYEGVVIGDFKDYYLILGVPIKKTMYEDTDNIYGDPVPYKFCINKYIDETQERVLVVKDVTLKNIA